MIVFYLMNRLRTRLYWWWLLSLVMVACQGTGKVSKGKDPVIATIGGEPILAKDFLSVYEKTLNTEQDQNYSEENLRNYLDLYLNFRLKILDAQRQGIDQDPDFQRELESYQEELAKPYLIDQEKMTELMREAYERLQEEVNVSHILLKVEEDAEPADTMLVYERILDLRRMALSGKNFEELAQSYSQDPAAQDNAGNLGYFTALQMMYNFENASYNTQVGSISNLLRTRFGYHFVKVLDRRPATGKLQTAHIMVRVPPNATAEDSLLAEKKIQTIHERLRNGEDWAALCLQFSDDDASRNKGGELPEFAIGTVIPAFEQAAVALEQPGDISTPFRTNYGWHIVRLLKKTNLESYEELQPVLRQKVMRDTRYQVIQESLIQKLQVKNNLKDFPKTLQKALAQADKKLLDGNWSYRQTDLLREVLFSFEDKTYKVKKDYTVGMFFEYLYERQVPKAHLKTPAFYMQWYYERFLDQSTLDFERSLLPMQYPEYRMLVKEYKEGMMLFQMMNDSVWGKALKDSAGVRAYFEQNRDNYRWDYRAVASIYDVADYTTLGKLRARLDKGYYTLDEALDILYFEKESSQLGLPQRRVLDQLAERLNADPQLLLELGGHQDNSEKPALSQARNKAVTQYLLAKKVPVEQLIISDFGAFRLASRNDKDRNRRVELTLHTTDKKYLAQQLNAENPLALRFYEGVFAKGDNSYLDAIQWEVGTNVVEINNRVVMIQIQSIEQPRLKNFHETQGAVIADYQNYLEQTWLTALREKYPVQINEETFQQIIQR